MFPFLAIGSKWLISSTSYLDLQGRESRTIDEAWRHGCSEREFYHKPSVYTQFQKYERYLKIPNLISLVHNTQHFTSWEFVSDFIAITRINLAWIQHKTPGSYQCPNTSQYLPTMVWRFLHPYLFHTFSYSDTNSHSILPGSPNGPLQVCWKVQKNYLLQIFVVLKQLEI